MQSNPTIHLSDTQKSVLATVKAAPTPQLGFEALMKSPEDIDDNVTAARDTLADLGLITLGDGTIELTDEGEQVMQDENLTDETGELTPDGQALVITDKETEPATEPEMGMGMGSDMGGMPPLNMSHTFTFGSLTLLKETHQLSKFKKKPKKY